MHDDLTVVLYIAMSRIRRSLGPFLIQGSARTDNRVGGISLHTLRGGSSVDRALFGGVLPGAC